MTVAPSHTNLPACPPWCTSPASHPYTGKAADGSYVARYHEAPNLAGVQAEHEPMSIVSHPTISTNITSEQQAVSHDGSTIQAAPVITLWTENPVLTAGDARPRCAAASGG